MVRFFFVVFIFSWLGVSAQTKYKVIKEITIDASCFTIDQLDNIYFLKNAEIIKINLFDTQRKTYSNNLFGEITGIDTSDPFRIIIFNKDFNKILFLDNSLSEIVSPISLNNLGYYNVTAVCHSNSGGFWIFDQNLNELVYFDQNLQQDKKSSQITSLLDPEREIEEVFMLEKNDYIYLGIRGEGVLLFDIYGSYIKTFPLIDIGEFQVFNDKIIYFFNGTLNLYDTKNFNKDILDLPIENSIHARIKQNNLYVLTNEKLVVYQLNNIK